MNKTSKTKNTNVEFLIVNVIEGKRTGTFAVITKRNVISGKYETAVNGAVWVVSDNMVRATETHEDIISEWEE